MELSNPHAFGAKGVKKPTRDFLSLYTSEDQQDPISNIPDDYLKTQDFLRPLEHVGKDVGNEGLSVENSKSYTPPTTVEHILPGGMGTYSISHISYVNQNQSQKAPKPRGIVISATQSSSSDNNDENSNCSSYTGSGFTLWEDSNVNKGKTGKENITGTRHTMRNEGMKIGMPWMTTMEQPSQSSSIHNHPSTTFSSLSSSHPTSAPKNRYVDTLKFGKGVQQEEGNDEVFVIKKEPTFHNKGAVRVNSANHDQKPNSPRSKHSATEQRRRSKINDRFSMLRRILPHGDQKRDKASFLLEVIEYIQFLQEKVHKYEDSGQGWTNEPPKKILLNNGPTINIVDQPQLPTSSLDAFKETGQHPAASHIHISTIDTITTASQAQPQLSHSRSCKTDYSITSDKLKDQEMITESGTVSISTIYSQGLSTALTEALKSSGVDLSHASISVKVDLGKRSKSSTLDSLPPDLKENKTPSIDQSSVRSGGEGFKRLKTSRY
uniref:transcription factor BIM1 n=1 Tax=Erigeron canadensis TaxID=72917 RepID=UPI001CB8A081|nr:transcription factor BIM1 [Erigeron canadensis]